MFILYHLDISKQPQALLFGLYASFSVSNDLSCYLYLLLITFSKTGRKGKVVPLHAMKACRQGMYSSTYFQFGIRSMWAVSFRPCRPTLRVRGPRWLWVGGLVVLRAMHCKRSLIRCREPSITGMSNLITVELAFASKNEVEFYNINVSKIWLMTPPPRWIFKRRTPNPLNTKMCLHSTTI